MRFKDFLITLLVSTITSLIVVWALINAGIIPTHQQIPKQYIKQTHSGTLVGVFNETSGEYEAYIERIPIENVSDRTPIRILHVSLEANVTNYDPHRWVNIKSLQLKDQQTEIVVIEKTLRFKPTSYGFLNIDTSVNPIRAFYISIKAVGNYNFTLTYDVTIIQEVLI